jgi:hypothetical protein
MKVLRLLPALSILLFVTPAAAAEGVKRIGVQAGFAGVTGEGTFSGYGGGLTFGYGLTDSVTLVGTATASSNQVAEGGGRGYVLSQAVGATYSLDVLQIVPWLGAFAAVYEIGGGGAGATRIKPGAQAAFGVDWIWSRDFTFGLDFRAHALPGDFLRSPDNPTAFYTTLFAKAEYTWGWF